MFYMIKSVINVHPKMLVFSLLIISFQLSGVINQMNFNCESKETCDDCIQDIACTWCSKLVRVHIMFNIANSTKYQTTYH